MEDNFEFEEDFENEDESASIDAAETEAVPVQPIADAPAASADDDFFAEDAAAEAPQVDPNTVVTIQTTSASDKFVVVERPTSMVDLIHMASLQFAGDFTCYLNGAQIELTTLVPGGQTVIIAGKVKGG